MTTWLKKQTLAFWTACCLAAPVGILIVDSFVAISTALTVNWGNADGITVFFSFAALFVLLVIVLLVVLLVVGVQRRNRLALALSIVVFPLLWGVEIGNLTVRNRIIDDAILVVSLGIAAAIAGVYIRELRRNWRC